MSRNRVREHREKNEFLFPEDTTVREQGLQGQVGPSPCPEQLAASAIKDKMADSSGALGVNRLPGP